MRYLLLSALLFITPSLSAQKFQLGINGGFTRIAVHNTQQGSIFEDADKYQAQVFSPLVSAKAMYVRNHYQYGIAVDFRTLSYKSNYIDEIWGAAFPIQMHFNDQQIPLKLFVNRTMQFKRIETYGGLALGYVFINSQSEVVTQTEVNKLTIQHPNSFVGDIHIGATYFVTKRLGINMEVTGEYINYPPLDKYNHSSSNHLDCNVLDKGNLSATIGIRYRL